MSIIIFLIVLAVLILVHEFGHFIVAKKSGIRVDEFGLGFPPKVFSKMYNGTLYTLNAIPFGGFVKIFGEDPHKEEVSFENRKSSFYYKPKFIQAAVLGAGVTFNILFAWLLISLGFMIGLPSPVEHSGLGEVRDVRFLITEVFPFTPAEEAGLRPGDTIVAISSGHIKLEGDNLNPENVSHTISESSSGNIEVSYIRGNDSSAMVSIRPKADEISGKKVIGIAMDEIGTLKLPVHLAIVEGARTTYLLTESTIIGLGQFLLSAVQFESDFSEVAGPVGIASIVSEANDLGFTYLISLVAVISINLAIINLLPIPALDGGRLLFVLIEAITRRRIPIVFIQRANVISFGFLILLTLLITGHDIFKLL